MVILDTKDRSTAIKVGRALGDQGCFHDVQYENVLLDSSTDIYQFKDIFFYNQPHQRMDKTATTAMSTSTTSWTMGTMKTNSTISDFSTDDRHTAATITTFDQEEDEAENDSAMTTPTIETTSSSLAQPPVFFVNGLFTPLTRCYAPSCNASDPCYSPLCPNQRRHSFTTTDIRAHTSIDSRTATPHTYLRQREQTSWAEMVSDQVLRSVSTTERKRQEAICELIYTEVNFVMDLDYVCKVKIRPVPKNSNQKTCLPFFE
jgi:hypothetical protein